MFTGIVTEKARVAGLETQNVLKARLTIESQSFRSDPPKIGESIAISGACLSVIELAEDKVVFELSEETLRRTSLENIGVGDMVNIERSLQLGQRLDGHIVLGHVDGTSQVLEIESEGDGEKFVFAMPGPLAKYIAEKGSITIDGVSLTIGELTDETFCVYIIPHTRKITLFSEYKVGSKVNLEIDTVARYLERIAQFQSDANGLPKA